MSITAVSANPSKIASTGQWLMPHIRVICEIDEEPERLNFPGETSDDYDRSERLECWTERDFEDVLLSLNQ